MAKSALKHAKRTPKVSFAGEMEQKCLKHLKTSKVAFSGEMSQIWNQKQLKVPKTAQNFFTWWNEPFSLQMAKSALNHIKTAQNTKSFICW